MKVLFWTDGFWPRIGGVETQAMEFIQSLQIKGHECVVIAQKDDSMQREAEIDEQAGRMYNGVIIKRFDFDKIIPMKQLEILHLIEEYLNWIIEEFQVEVVHLNTCFAWSAFAFSLFRNKFSVPVLLTIHAPFFYQTEISPLAAKVCKQVDQICCVSKWVVTEMQKLLPDAKNNLRLIYNGLPMPILEPDPLCLTPVTLLLLGRFTHEKGFDTAIKAFHLLKIRGINARLIIGGEGPYRSFLENLVEILELKEEVQFIGRVGREQVPILLNQASIVIVPSYFESFGLIALEAMQMQRPVIASKVGGLQEIVSHEETGLLVPPEDPEALCIAINSLINQPQKARNMGQQGRLRAKENFTLEKNVVQYEEVYKELIEASNLAGSFL